MKIKKIIDFVNKILLIIVTSFLYVGCFVEYACVDGVTQSRVLFAKNTLDYPVLVQCFYRQFSTSSDTLWCEKEPIEWSSPILLNVGERAIVMDYVKPIHIKIFRASDSLLLIDIKNLDVRELHTASNNAVSYSSEEVNTIGTQLTHNKKSLCFFEGNCYLQNDRYLLDNVPWDIYPIYPDGMNSCITQEVLDDSKIAYRKQANGYAVVSCIVFNKNAACFNIR